MCGIIGFTGTINAKEVIIEGLRSLEYRGYDSAGMAYLTEGGTQIVKTVGKVQDLADKIEASHKADVTTCGIGHTRWATHGGVTEVNAHPHRFGHVTLIHNGIIENFQQLADELANKGKKPVSETDTEIAAMIIDDCYDGNPLSAIRKAIKKLTGSYAFCIMFDEFPGKIYAIRNGSPLVAANFDNGSIVASDVTATIKYTKDYFVVPEHHIAELTPDTITLTDLQEKVIEPDMLHVSWDMTAARKGGYKYFMLKEIHEEPESLKNTIMPRIKDGLPDFSTDNVPDSIFEGVTNITIAACGTAWHAGLIGKSIIEKLTRIPVNCEIASEFRYKDPIIDEHTLTIIISQSGETADTLATLKLAREKGSRTLGVVNVKGSSIARESDYVLYTHAGPEIAVASTKAFMVQMSVMYLIAFRIALISHKASEDRIRELTKELINIPDYTAHIMTADKAIESIAQDLVKVPSVFFIGRGLDYALSCEGSLKLKEISYIHSEAYAAGELKHGTISLITDNVPVVALATQRDVFGKMISNVVEVRSRGAYVILITNEDADIKASLSDHVLTLPKIDDIFTPFGSAVMVQLLAYYTSYAKGLNVDQPRNLAKSVTVE
jgi:glucosamine--fructose-6-phosphate aminotransferase (isomerizing)